MFLPRFYIFCIAEVLHYVIISRDTKASCDWLIFFMGFRQQGLCAYSSNSACSVVLYNFLCCSVTSRVVNSIRWLFLRCRRLLVCQQVVGPEML
jgi:hypothetical protein